MVQVGVLGFSLPLVRRLDREIKVRVIEITRNVCVELFRMEQHKFAYCFGYCLEQFLGAPAMEETGTSRGLNAGTDRLLSVLHPGTWGVKGLNGFTNKANAQLGLQFGLYDPGVKILGLSYGQSLLILKWTHLIQN